MINSFEFILEKNENNFFDKNHCEIQVHTIDKGNQQLNF
jgi:hypothetical protein